MHDQSIVIRILRKTATWGAYVLALSLLGCASPPAMTGAQEPNYEGLVNVPARRLDVAQIRPETVFGRYTGVIVQPPELAFRAPDRAELQFPLTEDQKQRFHDMVASAFDAEFAQLNNLELVEQAGENVIELRVRIENITATVPPRRASGSGMQGFVLTAVGDVTFVLELYDSRTGQLLARGVDFKAVQGTAMMMDDEMVTRWSDVETLCTRWASVARTGLENLIENR